MDTVTFDTLKFAQHLEQAGLEPKQAAVFGEAQKEAFNETLSLRLSLRLIRMI